MQSRGTQSSIHHEYEVHRHGGHLQGEPADRLNDLPAALLTALESNQGVLICKAGMPEGLVLGRSTSSPSDLKRLVGFEPLDDFRQRLGANSILVYVVRVTPELAHALEPLFPDFPNIAEEIQNLTLDHGSLFAVYVATHCNRNYGPCGNLTVCIGGDCYRDDQVNFKSVLERTSLLAKAMMRKSVMMFPSIPALHGGKKGEWILMDAQGQAISGASETTKVVLGSVVVKRGIEFLNSFKLTSLSHELTEASRGIRMMPDSASPDTLSGKYWESLTRAWKQLGFDELAITCTPTDDFPTQSKNSPTSGSSVSAVPTGYGVAATAVRLVQVIEKPLADCRFLIEALGGVSFFTIDALLNRHGVRPEQITAFDPSPSACERARKAFPGVTIRWQSDAEFYADKRSDCFDVWINNGLGNRTTPTQVEWLLDHGVLLFCGGANNFLRKVDESVSLQAIWDCGVWAWPDEATSGGGWVYAVMDLYFRTLGQAVQRDRFLKQVIARVERSNVAFIETIIGTGPIPSGRELWQKIEAEIESRVKKSMSHAFSDSELLAAVDIRQWNI